MADKLFYSKTFIKDLLIIEALKKTDHEAPKTARQILKEVEHGWKKIFPNDPLNEDSKKKLVPATISRHVRDMNRSGLYQIEVHEDNKKGYYNARPLFTTAEATVIGTAIYNLSSLADDEKKNFLGKIKSATDTDGESIIYGFERQINLEEKSYRKGLQPSLFKIKTICKAVVEGKKISFRVKHNSITKESRQVTASPYFVFVKDNELFLTAKVDNSPTPTDFKLVLIREIEICNEKFQSDKKFSLKRHLRGVCKDTPLVELKISFPESFIENVVKQFGLKRIVQAAPNGNFSDGERQFRATIFVNEGKSLYQWLRQHCDKVRINFPDNVKDTLKAQLSRASSLL